MCQVLVWQALSTCDILRALSAENFCWKKSSLLGFTWRSVIWDYLGHFRKNFSQLSTNLGKSGKFPYYNFDDSKVINLQILKLQHLTWWRMLMLMLSDPLKYFLLLWACKHCWETRLFAEGIIRTILTSERRSEHREHRFAFLVGEPKCFRKSSRSDAAVSQNFHQKCRKTYEECMEIWWKVETFYIRDKQIKHHPNCKKSSINYTAWTINASWFAINLGATWKFLDPVPGLQLGASNWRSQLSKAEISMIWMWKPKVGSCKTIKWSAVFVDANPNTLRGTKIYPTKVFLKMSFPFPRWDMSVP